MYQATKKAIATSEQFKKALLVLRDKKLPESHFVMLRAQCRAAESTITATQLAVAAKYENYNAANLQYGTLALNLASVLGFVPDLKHADGSPCWWTVLSYADEEGVVSENGKNSTLRRATAFT